MSRLSLPNNDGVLFKPARKNKRFENFSMSLNSLRPDIPRKWHPQIPKIRKIQQDLLKQSKEEKYKKQLFMQDIQNRKAAIADDQDKIDQIREAGLKRKQDEATEWERQQAAKLAAEEKERQEKKEALLKSIFSNKFVHAGDNEKLNQEEEINKVSKKVMTLKIKNWAPHNTVLEGLRFLRV